MSEPFIFIAVSRLKPGKTDDFKRYYKDLSAFVHANEPRIIHFGTYFSDDGREMTHVMIHPDAESMEFHMQVAGEMIGKGYGLLEGTTSIDVYGIPNDAVIQMMKQIAGDGVPVNVTSDYSGFNRFHAVQGVA